MELTNQLSLFQTSCILKELVEEHPISSQIKLLDFTAWGPRDNSRPSSIKAIIPVNPGDILNYKFISKASISEFENAVIQIR